MGIRKTLKNLLGFKSDLASLTVVGVGPGDSSLLTIAAVEAIKKAKLIVFPISSDDRKSASAEIVKKYIKFKKKIGKMKLSKLSKIGKIKRVLR